ncbi:MAG: SMC family ATPase [Chloroflexi bacterium]|nr:SMC family ATPase [Chloroflexota bacterium]
MRPLILKFKGLRSYRAEQEIDFATVSLMAVVGDTGAGKSSLLEAVYFALYGGSTWDARGGDKKLIADGGDGTLRVELTFRARGKNWRITRTTSVNNYPPSTHHLEGLDDNIQVDNAGPVNNVIRKLIGLDNSAFLKAVILPQGRFQELLQTREADRTTIFKNVLGLDQITEVRRQATALHDRLNPHLEAIRRRRAALLPNPSQAISDATRRLSAAQKQAAKLDHIKNVVSEAQEVYDEAASRAREWRAVAQQLTAKIPDDTEGEYRRLIELEAQLANKLVTVDRQLDEAEEHEVDLKEVLDSADVDGTGVSGIASALATLQALLDQIPGLDDDQHIITDERAAIDADSATAHARKAAHAEIVNKAEHAQAKAESANATHSAATQNLEQCSTMLTQARHAAEAVATASVAAEHSSPNSGSADRRSRRSRSCGQPS